MFSNGFWEVWTLCDDVMIDDERVGGSRLWLPSAGAAAGVLQVTGAPGTLISLKRLQLRGEVVPLNLILAKRRVFQDVGGFGRRPILYRYFLRHIHAFPLNLMCFSLVWDIGILRRR